MRIQNSLFDYELRLRITSTSTNKDAGRKHGDQGLMRILGIHDGHNAAACLLEDGVITAALQEERLSRVKNHDVFPARAIGWLLERAGCGWAEIDAVALHMPGSEVAVVDALYNPGELERRNRKHNQKRNGDDEAICPFPRFRPAEKVQPTERQQRQHDHQAGHENAGAPEEPGTEYAQYDK
jgi:predicted NodU family carbamoyl transferase